MRLKAIPLLFLAVLTLLSPVLRAQQAASDSPSRFLDAYQMNTKAESLETSRDYAGALRLLKEANGILNEIAAKDQTWNKPIVDYRRGRITESIARLEGKLGTAGRTADTGGRNVETIPDLPLPEGSDSGIDPAPTSFGSSAKPKAGASRASKPTGDDPLVQLKNDRDELNAKLAQAQAQRDAAESALREEKAKLDKSTAERKRIEDQLGILGQRSNVAEQALRAELKKKTADAEKILNLETQSNKLKKEVTSLRTERDALEEVRGQEVTRHEAVSQRLTKASQASAEFKKTIEELEKNYNVKLSAVQKKLTDTQAERDGLQAKLTTVTAERDSFKTEVAKLKEDKKNLDKALADNALLMQKLSDAEKQIVQFKADNVQKDVLIADLKKEITNVSRQLDDAKKDSASYQVKMAQLQASLTTTSEKLALADTTASRGASDKKKMTAENDLLRGIVKRQLTAQAGRDQTRKLVLEELKSMEIKSKDLLSRINFLGEPVVKLTPTEAALFKKPQVEVGENEIALAAPKEGPSAPELPKSDPPAAVPAPATSAPLALATATPAPLTPPVPSSKSMAVWQSSPPATKVATPAPAPVAIATATPAKPTVVKTAAPVKSETPELTILETSRVSRPGSLDLPRSTSPASTGASEPRTEPATGGSVTETGAGPSTVPADLQPTAQSAKDNFDRGNYGAAEKLYENILAKAPANLYALSNLGVVQFRQGKLRLAEGSFRKAIAIAPEDAFSRCTLGIIYYSQNRFDEAVNELTKSLAINPKYAAAHNFLGITASQKGWQEAAQKELVTATELDPNYADAHFNLAVVYATQQPPNPDAKESARRLYKRATELGAEKDSGLELLLK
jgi:Tfp pilus assembly protein PilF/uncharacterized coiled-coil DUF342 family protein